MQDKLHGQTIPNDKPNRHLTKILATGPTPGNQEQPL